MTENTDRLSRRTLLATAGGLAASTAILGGEASAGIPAQTRIQGLSIRRIGIAASDGAKVARQLQAFLSSAAPLAASPIEHSGVTTESFWVGGMLIEVSQPAREGHVLQHWLDANEGHGGYLVGLESPAPEMVRDRAAIAGVRLARDMTIRGRSIIQLDPAVFEARFEASSALLPPPSGAASAGSIAGLTISCDHPALRTQQIAALFDATAEGNRVRFGSRTITFAAPATDSDRKGLSAVSLAASDREARGQTARIAGVEWRLV